MDNVLSLFDGLGGARIALDRLGIKCNYYASEVDKYAIQISKKNYPDIIQLGDIKKIDSNNLPKIDLLIGGSPCSNLSICGDKTGLKGEQSKLFWEYVRLLKELNPKYFLLENVYSMSKINRDIITNELKVEPIIINSSLVTGQNRKRLYWTNIPNIQQPKDRKIFLKDIIEHGYVDRLKSHCLDANYFKGTNLAQYLKKHRRQIVYINIPFALTETRTEEAKQIRKEYRKLYNRDFSPRRGKELKPRFDNKSNCLTTGCTKEHLLFDGIKIRKLTPIECERLQGLPDNYTMGVSNTQRYKMIGNGFTIPVIEYILKNMEFNHE